MSRDLFLLVDKYLLQSVHHEIALSLSLNARASAKIPANEIRKPV